MKPSTAAVAIVCSAIIASGFAIRARRSTEPPAITAASAITAAPAVAPASQPSASYLEACELVKQRQADMDKIDELRPIFMAAHPTKEELDQFFSHAEAIGLAYQKALSLRKSLEPKR